MNSVGGRGRKYERDASREESQQRVRSCVRLLFSRRYPTVDHRWKRIAVRMSCVSCFLKRMVFQRSVQLSLPFKGAEGRDEEERFRCNTLNESHTRVLPGLANEWKDNSKSWRVLTAFFLSIYLLSV